MVTEQRLMELTPFEKYPCSRVIDGEKMRFSVEPKQTVFVFGKSCRTRGRRYLPGDFLSLYRVEEEDLRKKDPTPAWHRRIQRAVRCMESSGLWPEVRQRFENILASGMTWTDRDRLIEIWSASRQREISPEELAEIERYRARFPFAFCQDNEGEDQIDTSYVYALTACKLKAMYFGRWSDEKDRIRKALAERRDYRSGRIRAGYDVSFEYDAEKKKAWYSEEFRGCGNGHYYIALDANTALFVEDD